jgi:carboxylesterase type B
MVYSGTINYLVLSPQLQVHVRRVIMCSSTCSTIQLLREDQAQQSFDTLCRHLNIDPEYPNGDAVSKLRDIPVEQLLSHGSSISHAFRPTWDDVTISSDPRQVVFKPELWDESLTEMIIGVCQSEVSCAPCFEISMSLSLKACAFSRGQDNPHSLTRRRTCNT